MDKRLYHSGDKVKRLSYDRKTYKRITQSGVVLGTVMWGFEDETVEWYYVKWAGQNKIEETSLTEDNRG